MADSKSSLSPTVRFYCRCGQKLRAPHNARGRRARCPSCGHVFRIKAPIETPITINPTGSTILSSLRQDTPEKQTPEYV